MPVINHATTHPLRPFRSSGRTPYCYPSTWLFNALGCWCLVLLFFVFSSMGSECPTVDLVPPLVYRRGVNQETQVRVCTDAIRYTTMNPASVASLLGPQSVGLCFPARAQPRRVWTPRGSKCKPWPLARAPGRRAGLEYPDHVTAHSSTHTLTAIPSYHQHRTLR